MVKLSKDEIDYELGIHDCGQNPYCNRYRSCDLAPGPILSKEKQRILKKIGTKRLLEQGFKYSFINQYFKDKWKK